MNAVIALCHFCEAHGPSPILCTQTLRQTKVEEIDFEEIQCSNKLCPACNSIGGTGILSRDDTTNTSYLSTQSVVFPELSKLIKQASIRSLSCEISSKKDGGFVFFGDTLNGHILSHTFHVSDLQARGFYQLFSIIVVMKDKYYLLNIKPFLSKYILKISSEIQELAKIVRNEEKSRSSPIERRISGGSQIIPSTPRSLVDLTGDINIFEMIHTNFTWILAAGTKCLIEDITFENFSELSLRSESTNIFTIKPNSDVDTCNESRFEESNDGRITLRDIREMLGSNFVKLCFCILTGINVLIRGPPERTTIFVESVKIILPEEMHILILTDSVLVDTRTYKIVTVQTEVAVPMPSTTIFRIDCMESQNDQLSVKWLGELPNKLPNLFLEVMKAVDEVLFTDLVLITRLKALAVEWKNKILHLAKIKSSSDLTKLKKVLGVFPQDQSVINYWQKFL